MTFNSILYAIGIGYILGSIPFGYLLTKIAGYGDVRSLGSGSIGTTNVLRTGNRWLAALTLLLDAGKGALATALFISPVPDVGLIAGASAVIGHVFPIWLKFKGGKGVATSLAVLFIGDWHVALIALGIWGSMLMITRYSSVASLTATGVCPLLAWQFSTPSLVKLAVFLCVLIVYCHRTNIKRLYQGTEPKVGKKTNLPSSQAQSDV